MQRLPETRSGGRIFVSREQVLRVRFDKSEGHPEYIRVTQNLARFDAVISSLCVRASRAILKRTGHPPSNSNSPVSISRNDYCRGVDFA